MQNIDKQEIRELLTIIPKNYPAHDIFHLTTEGHGLCEEIHQLCDEQKYYYDLSIPDKQYFEYIEKNTDIKPNKFNYNKSRYNRQAKQYDFVFVQVDLKNIQNLDMFYKKLYMISKNGGSVLFILDKDEDKFAFMDILIGKNYVAVNPIENTFKDYQIICAQKMHGWGD